MLKKLIKHDFRALSRVLFPLQLALFAAAVVAGIFLAINLNMGSSIDSSAIRVVFAGISTTAIVLICIAIVASALVTVLIVAVQLYRNFLGDEGYLTFTLPATTTQLLWSKVITGTLWIIINALVILLSFGAFLVIGLAWQVEFSEFWAQANRYLPKMIEAAQQYVSLPLLAVELLVAGVTATVSELLHIYLSVIIGGMIAKKHKILAAIGMYFAISIGASTITSVLTAILGQSANLAELNLGIESVGPAIYGVLGASILFSVVLSAVFFLSTRALLKNKLNLQ